VRYSADGGETWQPVATGITQNEYEVPIEELAGGDRCLLQISAHDGWHSVYRVIGPFRVRERPPQTVILQPEMGQSLRSGGKVLLVGNGFAPGEGSLTQEALRWRSDRDGDLGAGKRLFADLSQGRHEIILTATDSAGRTASTSVGVDIFGEEDNQG
jgi:hypothetical protein